MNIISIELLLLLYCHHFVPFHRAFLLEPADDFHTVVLPLLLLTWWATGMVSYCNGRLSIWLATYMAAY
jgi:hypothetical protein